MPKGKKKAEEIDAAAAAAGNLSKWEVAQFKEAFALFDLKKDGTLDPDELKELMAMLGTECSDEEIADLVAEADKLSSGRIDFPSFLQVFQHDSEGAPEPENFIRQAYELVGGGEPVTGPSMAAFLKTLGLTLIPEEYDRMVKQADADGDGSIGYEDFKALYLKIE